MRSSVPGSLSVGTVSVVPATAASVSMAVHDDGYGGGGDDDDDDELDGEIVDVCTAMATEAAATEPTTTTTTRSGRDRRLCAVKSEL